MFTDLTEDEQRELANRLRRAGERLGDEANMLAECPPEVLAAYNLPRDGYHDFYSAAIEASMLSVEVWRRPVPASPVLVTDSTPAGSIVPTGTGWPVT